MTTRNFEFRVPPRSGERDGRWATAAELVIGVPVKLDADGDVNELGMPAVELATGAQAPQPGLSGILYYEHIQYLGDDPHLTTWSDKGTAPAGAAVQVISGDTVKLAFRNTTEQTFLNSRTYPGRVMVAGTPEVGDLLTPGTGNDTDGYWAVNATASNAWLVVTAVDAATGLVEARLRF